MPDEKDNVTLEITLPQASHPFPAPLGLRHGAQDALQCCLRYPGAVVVVLHDRFFLKALGPDVAVLGLN